MSNLIFPSSLAGCDIKITPEPVDDVQASESASGKEIRQTASTYQRKRWTLDFNILRTDSAMADSTRWRELQQLFTQWARSFGRLSDFLFTDPDDASVVDMGFAVGDGATTAFQIQRSMAGDLIDQLGEWTAATKPRTNVLFPSEDLTGAGWGLNTGTRILANCAIAPDGSPTADAVLYDGTGSAGDYRAYWTGPAMLKGRQYAGAIWLRADAPLSIRLGDNIGGASVVCALTTAWQRFSVTGTAATTNVLQLLTYSANADNTAIVFYAWGGQIETGSTATRYIPTTSGTVTVTPSYWPGFGDGFEPIPDLNGSPTIYEDGTWRGRRTLYPYTRRNLLPFSEQFDNAAWTKTNTTITANSTTAPDGTATGDTISEGAANAQHYVALEPGPTQVQGQLLCYSVFVKANNLPNIIWGRDNGSFIKFNLGTGVIDGLGGVQGNPIASGVITDPRWPGWSRIWFVNRAPASPVTSNAYLFPCLDSTYSAAAYAGTSRTFFAWGAMCELVSNLSGPTPYIQTPSSTGVTVTDYTLSSTGVFTPVAVPAAGTFFSFDGAFYRRVRFDLDSMPASRLAQYMYEAKQIKLILTK